MSINSPKKGSRPWIFFCATCHLLNTEVGRWNQCPVRPPRAPADCPETKQVVPSTSTHGPTGHPTGPCRLGLVASSSRSDGDTSIRFPFPETPAASQRPGYGVPVRPLLGLPKHSPRRVAGRHSSTMPAGTVNGIRIPRDPRDPSATCFPGARTNDLRNKPALRCCVVLPALHFCFTAV